MSPATTTADLNKLDPDTLLEHLRGLSTEIDSARVALNEQYAQQTRLFKALRRRKVFFRTIGEAAGVSEEAVVQRLRAAAERPKTRRRPT